MAMAPATPQAQPPQADSTPQPKDDGTAFRNLLSRIKSESDDDDQVEEDVPSPSDEVLSSEAEAPSEEALEDEDNPDETEPAQATTSDPGPDTSSEGNPPETDAGAGRKYAGKFDSVDELEKSYKSNNAETSKLANQLRQAQAAREEAESRLVEMAYASGPKDPPTFEELNPEQKQYFKRLGDAQGRDPQEFVNAAFFAENQQRAQQAASARQHQQQYKQGQYAAAESLVRYAVDTYGEDNPAVIEEFDSNREIFEVIRHLAPDAIERVGKKFLGILGENAKLRAERGARDTAVRDATRKESQTITRAKTATAATASKGASTPTVGAPVPRQTDPTRAAIDRMRALKTED